jgi:hypothetical protein
LKSPNLIGVSKLRLSPSNELASMLKEVSAHLLRSLSIVFAKADD